MDRGAVTQELRLPCPSLGAHHIFRVPRIAWAKLWTKTRHDPCPFLPFLVSAHSTICISVVQSRHDIEPDFINARRPEWVIQELQELGQEVRITIVQSLAGDVFHVYNLGSK